MFIKRLILISMLIMILHILVTHVLISEQLLSSQLPQANQVWPLQHGVRNESRGEKSLKMFVTTLWTTCWLVENDSIFMPADSNQLYESTLYNKSITRHYTPLGRTMPWCRTPPPCWTCWTSCHSPQKRSWRIDTCPSSCTQPGSPPTYQWHYNQNKRLWEGSYKDMVQSTCSRRTFSKTLLSDKE